MTAPILAFSIILSLGLVAPAQPETTASDPLPGLGVLKGMVSAQEGGAPVAGARVVVCLPTCDMREARRQSKVSGLRLVETTTGPDGAFEVKVPCQGARAEASIDVFAPGYRSLAGAWAADDSTVRATVGPDTVAEVVLKLVPAAYVAGVVVDEEGAPVAGVEITATLRAEGGYSNIAMVESGADGRFAVYDFPEQRPEKMNGQVSFKQTRYDRAVIPDVYALSSEQNRNHRVVLHPGTPLAGHVHSSTGALVAGAMVEATFEDPEDRRATLTGSDGAFALTGLPSGTKCTLLVQSMAIHEKARISLPTDKNNSGLEVILAPFRIPSDAKPVSLLGMRVVPVTPATAEAYDLPDPSGLLILDPGPDHARLGIGLLVEGDCLWLAGDYLRFASVQEMARSLLAQVDRPEGPRIVYTYRRIESSGTDTQYLHLTDTDVTELRKLAGF